jgi:hypothetical protein
VPPQAQVQSLFQTERYDAPPATTAAEMQWTFPAASGVTYTVNLYFAEIFTGTQSVGARVFDVTIEDVLVLDNYDVFADVGANTGVMKSFQVNLADDFIDIDFDRVTENPAIKAIEILAAGEEASGSIPAGGVLTTDTEADGATASDPVETTITMPSVGRTVRRHDPGGSDQRRPTVGLRAVRPAVQHHAHPQRPERERPVRDHVRAAQLNPASEPLLGDRDQVRQRGRRVHRRGIEAAPDPV